MQRFLKPTRSLVNLLRAGTTGALNLLLPPHCVLCRTGTPAGEYLCPQCLKTNRPICEPRCFTCSQPFDGALESPFACSTCRDRHFAFSCAVATRKSEGAAREILHLFKYSHHYHLRHPLARWLLEAFSDPRLTDPAPTALVPVPLHPTRKRERGFNQAEVLTRMISAKTGIPALFPLKKVRFTSSQTRLDRSRRMENLRNAFALRHNADVRDLHLVIIDDVFTTGSTVHECARLLKAAGAASVRTAAVIRG